uniref:Putative secreted peptide n=1 Tax=Anopheles braziliensis TaxID=58242 RepID=A0A2M3ZQ69_9DIPT
MLFRLFLFHFFFARGQALKRGGYNRPGPLTNQRIVTNYRVASAAWLMMWPTPEKPDSYQEGSLILCFN